MKRHCSKPFPPSRLPFFYGWVILGAGIIGILMSIPGQTMGVSVFTENLLEDLEKSLGEWPEWQKNYLIKRWLKTCAGGKP